MPLPEGSWMQGRKEGQRTGLSRRGSDAGKSMDPGTISGLQSRARAQE